MHSTVVEVPLVEYSRPNQTAEWFLTASSVHAIDVHYFYHLSSPCPCENDVYTALLPTQSAQVRWNRLQYCSFAGHSLDWSNFTRSTRARSVNRTDESSIFPTVWGPYPEWSTCHIAAKFQEEAQASRGAHAVKYVRLFTKESSNRSAAGYMLATNKAKDHPPSWLKGFKVLPANLCRRWVIRVALGKVYSRVSIHRAFLLVDILICAKNSLLLYDRELFALGEP
jgi:hypothetical protein